MSSLMVVSLYLLAAISTVTAYPVPDQSCALVHIFVARGTYEPPGTGAMGSLADLVVQSHPAATVEAIDYPAGADPYIPSVNQGIDAVTNQLTNYASKCPQSQIVLMGYSQGIHIILDALCGSGNPAWGGTGWASVSEEIGSHVKTVVGYGDPAHTINEVFDRGSGTKNGEYPRPPGVCDSYASRIVSYCDKGDPVCAGGDNMQVHMGYLKYNSKAASFVNSHLSGGS